MNRTAICLLLGACLVAPCVAEEELPHITTGPILGRLSAHGIGVWARTSRASSFQVRYGLAADKMDQITEPVPTRLEHDNTGWMHITDLKARTPSTGTTSSRFLSQVGAAPPAADRSRTLPDGRPVPRIPEHNPDGLLYNFSLRVRLRQQPEPPTQHPPDQSCRRFGTMLRPKSQDDIHFAILNGDWLYEVRSASTTRPSGLAQVDMSRRAEDPKDLLHTAPTLTGVWENYKHFFLEQS